MFATKSCRNAMTRRVVATADASSRSKPVVSFTATVRSLDSASSRRSSSESTSSPGLSSNAVFTSCFYLRFGRQIQPAKPLVQVDVLICARDGRRPLGIRGAGEECIRTLANRHRSFAGGDRVSKIGLEVGFRRDVDGATLVGGHDERLLDESEELSHGNLRRSNTDRKFNRIAHPRHPVHRSSKRKRRRQASQGNASFSGRTGTCLAATSTLRVSAPFRLRIFTKRLSTSPWCLLDRCDNIALGRFSGR